MMRHFSLRRSAAALPLAATMSLAAAGAAVLGSTAAHADAPPGAPVGTLALNCGTGQDASATATINHGALVDGDFRFYYSTTSGVTGYTDMPVGVIASPARTTDFVAQVNGVAGASYTSVTLYAVGAVGVTFHSPACQ
jgi:hypothetical protein